MVLRGEQSLVGARYLPVLGLRRGRRYVLLARAACS